MPQSREQLLKDKVEEASRFLSSIFTDDDMIPVLVVGDVKLKRIVLISQVETSDAVELLKDYLASDVTLETADVYAKGH